MTTQICIDASAGQDCLEFTSTGKGPGSGWNFVSIQSCRKTKKQVKPNSTPAVSAINQGLFYVNQSAYGQLV